MSRANLPQRATGRAAVDGARRDRYDARVSYLKLIANAFWAGLYGSVLITLLLFLLNDDLRGRSPAAALAGGLAAVSLVYVPVLSILLPTLFVFVRFFAARRLGLSWLTLKAIVWFAVTTLGALSVVYYDNLRWAASLLSPASRDAMRITLWCMGGCWLMALALAVTAQARPTVSGAGHALRLGACAALLLPPVVATVLSVRLPSATGSAETGGSAATPARHEGGAPSARAPARTLLIVGLQAASMDDILPLVASRGLPEFERLLKEGASARLESITPCVSRVAWTALSTGMPPWATGVKDTRTYRLAFWPAAGAIQVLPRSLGMVALGRAGYVRTSLRPAVLSAHRMFWQILRDAGLSIDVVGWSVDASEAADPRTVADDDPRVAARLDQILGGTAGAAGARPAPEDAARLAALRRAVAVDLSSRDRAVALARSGSITGAAPRVMAVMYPGLGMVARHFLRYQRPEEFGDVTPEESSRYGKVMERYYQFVDELIAEQEAAMGTMASQPTVMVVSAHGVSPVPAGERFVRKLLPRGESDLATVSGSWRSGPDGVLLLKGRGVGPGVKVDDGDIKDVVPAALYLLGLPLERPLRGDLLRRLFARDFLESHPVLIVPSRDANSL